MIAPGRAAAQGTSALWGSGAGAAGPSLMSSGFMGAAGGPAGMAASMLPGVLGAVMDNSPSGPAISGITTPKTEALFDNSGWNVNFGSGSVSSDRQQLPSVGGFDTSTILLIGAGGLLALLILRRKKNG